MPLRGTPFFGHTVLRSTFVLAMFGWGLGFYGPPIYMQVVLERTGWPLGLLSGMVTLHFLFGAVVTAALPRLHARHGLSGVTLWGAVALAVGIMGWALAARPWQLALAALLTGGGWVCLGAAAVNAILAPWFVRSRPTALSMAYNGASVGGVVLSPLWAALIPSLSFPVAAVLVTGTMAIVVALMSLRVFAKTPEELGQWPDGAPAPATARPVASPAPRPQAAADAGSRRHDRAGLLRDPAFLTLAAGMALGLFAQAGLIAHLFSVLTPGFGSQAAGAAMSLVTACAVGGRLLVARAMPPSADRRLVAGLCCGVQLLGSLLLLASGGQDLLLIGLGIVLFGAGVGNLTSLPPLIVQQEFAEARVQQVVALVVAVSQATYAFAPAAFGWLRSSDLLLAGRSLDDPAALFLGVAAVQGLAIAAMLAGRGRRGRTETRRPSPG